MRKDNINYERLKKTRRGGQGEGGRGKGERGSRRMEQRTSVAVPRSINKGPGKWTRDVPRHEFWRHRNDSGDTRDEALGSALPACDCVGRLIALRLLQLAHAKLSQTRIGRRSMAIRLE